MESALKANSQRGSVHASDAPLFCDDHPNEQITNFCYASLRALCPSCIDLHNKMMRQNNVFPEIDTIRNAKINCSKRCHSAILALQGELSNLENQMVVNPTAVIEEGVFQLRRARDRLISYINKYVEGLEAEYERNVMEAVTKANTTTDSGEKVQSLIRELETLMQNIETPYCVPTVQKIYKIDFQALVEKFRADIQQAMVVRENIPQGFSEIVVNDSKFAEISENVQRFITLRKKEVPVASTVGRPEEKSNYVEKYPVDQYVQNDAGFARYHKEYRNDLSEEFRVSMPDYFEPQAQHKCLHFFQNHENRFHYVDVNNLTKHSRPSFQSIELNANFTIPPFHKSLVVPSGDIYLVGGSNSDDPSRKLSTTYLFEWQTRSLVPKAQMSTPRSSFAICYMNKSIYVAGGLTNNSMFTRKCERYDIAVNKWTPIADLNYDVLAPCMTAFNNRYIFKFGGYNQGNYLEPFIEKYDPNRNVWTVCRVRIELPSTIKPEYFKILTTSACTQINTKDIYVFGGYLEDNTSSNQTFIFRINNEDDDSNPQNYTITKIGVKSLTHPEAFWNNSAVVLNRQVYALQNVQTLEHEDVCLDDKRRLVCFNSSEWFSLA